MQPTTYNLLEAMVRAVQAMAREMNCDEALKQDLTGKLTSVKVMMQRHADEDVVQAMAETVIALTKFVTGLKPAVETPIQKKHVLRALEGLRKHHEDRERMRESVLHPSGRCTCAGDGTCEWCQSHCVECGFALDGDGHCENCDAPPEYELQHGGELRRAEAKTRCPTCDSDDVDLDIGKCRCCGYLLDAIPGPRPESPEETPGFTVGWEGSTLHVFIEDADQDGRADQVIAALGSLVRSWAQES